MKKLSKGRNRSLTKDFTSGTSLIKDSGRLDTRAPTHDHRRTSIQCSLLHFPYRRPVAVQLRRLLGIHRIHGRLKLYRGSFTGVGRYVACMNIRERTDVRRSDKSMIYPTSQLSLRYLPYSYSVVQLKICWE